MKLRIVTATGVPAHVMGVQRERVKALHKGKVKAMLAVDEVSNEEELLAAITDVLDNSVLEADFDSPEEAARVGLLIDAKGKGDIGVGIQGRKVSFWKRTV